MFQYTLIKHCCLPTQHSRVPAAAPSQRAPLPLLAFASNYCPLQVKSQPRRALRRCRALCGREPPGSAPPGPSSKKIQLSLGLVLQHEGSDVISLGGATSRESQHQRCSGRPQPPFQSWPGDEKTKKGNVPLRRCVVFFLSLSPQDYGKLPRQTLLFPWVCRKSRKNPAPNRMEQVATLRIPPTFPVGQLFFGHNLRVCFSHSLSQGDLAESQAGYGGGCRGPAR